MDVVPADGATPVWHPDVRFFRLEKGGVPAAYFFFDPYSRPAEKRSGAWMNEVVGRWLLPADSKAGGGTVRLPVALMVCNQPPPVGDQPSLMTFRDVETVFHELVREWEGVGGAGVGVRARRAGACVLPSLPSQQPIPLSPLSHLTLTSPLHSLPSVHSFRATPCSTC